MKINNTNPVVVVVVVVVTDPALSKVVSTCYFVLGGEVMYTGTKSSTVSGRSCQSWDQQCPHKHSYADATLVDEFAAEENYCRGFQYKKAVVLHNRP